ncbi:helix-turn-helix transcriptional regulator [Cryobacterium sp. PH31-O1]|uniref:helix-turn-helix domain-containing protein n=1 Tax=Cryobacterium sp. PH31-O1 TaxID=3046306 RepID=UPI0024BB5E86|nr:helix-turn-helix transcriptional regulator [Cryobacterium sp. PH31-O1]MDJ0337621.1 helix-turn-helix transcriptional regulator [Cryobacterium sp. PH31-O1]
MKSDTRKFSLDNLPGDDWEVRFTKGIVRTIAHYRDLRGLTTEQLAAKCSEALGEPGKIKGNTLNGLFAGKRKSIGMAEMLVFARALDVPPIFLMLPMATGDDVEIGPGESIHAYAAYCYVTAVPRQPLEYKLETRTYRELGPWDNSTVILDTLARHETAINQLRMATEEWLGSRLVIEETKGKVRYAPKWDEEHEALCRDRLQTIADARFKLRAKGVTPPPIPPAIAFVDEDPVPAVELPLMGFVEESGVLSARAYQVKQIMK